MIISPARFEDMVNECLGSNTDEQTKKSTLNSIITATLTSMGYGAGVKSITAYMWVEHGHNIQRNYKTNV